MSVRFLTPNLHGVVDYAAAVGLITMPFVLGLGESHPLAKWLAVATGVAVILVSALTKYKLALLPVLPFKAHLAIDFAVAVAFVATPLVLGFSDLDAVYYWVNAIAVFAVVAVSQPEERSELATV